MKVVYLTMQFEPDLSNAGAPDSPNYAKHKAMGVGEVVPVPDGRETGRSSKERGGQRSCRSSRPKRTTSSLRSTAIAASSKQSSTRSCASTPSNRSSSPRGVHKLSRVQNPFALQEDRISAPHGLLGVDELPRRRALRRRADRNLSFPRQRAWGVSKLRFAWKTRHSLT